MEWLKGAAPGAAEAGGEDITKRLYTETGWNPPEADVGGTQVQYTDLEYMEVKLPAVLDAGLTIFRRLEEETHPRWPRLETCFCPCHIGYYKDE